MLKQLDEKLTLLNQELTEVASKLEFQAICEFNMATAKKIPWDKLKYKGIYLLEIQNETEHETFENWVENFQVEWEKEEYKWRFVPNLKKKRIKMHSELKDWIPIYLGKSRNIEKRIYEHIFIDLKRNTFALKLNSRDNMHDKNFRLSIMKIETANYDWVVPKLERFFRDKINPLIGKQ
jgi:hypothetical protein